MKPLFIPALLILAQATAWPDGGAVLLRRDTGDIVITVFTSPSPLSVGPVDISVLLQNRKGLEPVLDANVFVFLHENASGVEFKAHPTREQARNKLLYAAPVMFSQPGQWRMAVPVVRSGRQTGAGGKLEVAPDHNQVVSYAGYIAFPPIMIVLFVVRERLIRRRSKG
jgi:hypothetical protein